MLSVNVIQPFSGALDGRCSVIVAFPGYRNNYRLVNIATVV